MYSRAGQPRGQEPERLRSPTYSRSASWPGTWHAGLGGINKSTKVKTPPGSRCVSGAHLRVSRGQPQR